jgi:hypothetical protein
MSVKKLHEHNKFRVLDGTKDDSENFDILHFITPKSSWHFTFWILWETKHPLYHMAFLEYKPNFTILCCKKNERILPYLSPRPNTEAVFSWGKEKFHDSVALLFVCFNYCPT